MAVSTGFCSNHIVWDMPVALGMQKMFQNTKRWVLSSK